MVLSAPLLNSNFFVSFHPIDVDFKLSKRHVLRFTKFLTLVTIPTMLFDIVRRVFNVFCYLISDGEGLLYDVGVTMWT